ncbi:MAG: radical SAM protein [Alphaproteobacteria bacterium]|jgi:hypothetical protein|nr:radical SAM protein [Alphaproteobacteria bacterium]MDP6517156.1 radical SAM protein [Alphaproteobacteria bacterium]
MSSAAAAEYDRLDPRKFRDPFRTIGGERRAHVGLEALETLWFNTGTLCNLACENCYIESSPTNDSLSYLSLTEVQSYLDEIEAAGLGTGEIGFTGGEPFMNPDFMAMLALSLDRGFRVLVLTNAMRPMMKSAEALAALGERHGDRLRVRVSLDHYTQTLHETERGARSWRKAIDGLCWLKNRPVALNVAGRLMWGEPENDMRAGYGRLFAELGLAIDADNPGQLVLFPEMDAAADVAEISAGCWQILGVNPSAMMCATSRMVIKRKGARAPALVPCTLLPDDPQFDLGTTLATAAEDVRLNHPHCARFCVLGGGSCSAG